MPSWSTSVSDHLHARSAMSCKHMRRQPAQVGLCVQVPPAGRARPPSVHPLFAGGHAAGDPLEHAMPDPTPALRVTAPPLHGALGMSCIWALLPALLHLAAAVTGCSRRCPALRGAVLQLAWRTQQVSGRQDAPLSSQAGALSGGRSLVPPAPLLSCRGGCPASGCAASGCSSAAPGPCPRLRS